MIPKYFYWLLIVSILINVGCENQDPVSTNFATIESLDSNPELQEFNKRRMNKKAIIVMTRNVYVGANVDTLLSAQDLSQIPILVAYAFQQLLSTNFPERAKALAKEIYRTRPHLIGLQEISLIRKQSPGDVIGGGTSPAEGVVFDFLDILMDAISSKGMNYQIAGIIQNSDVEMPMVVNTNPLEFDDVRLTDYDVVLARNDVQISNVVEANFQTRLIIPGLGIEIPRGYVAVDATLKHKTYRFVNTHLEPTPIPELIPIQMGQAQELVAAVQGETNPTIIVGDFNSSATSGETYQFIESQDFVDAWTKNLLPFNTDGFTDRHDYDLRNTVVKLDKRIDLIWVKSNVRKNGKQKIGPVVGIVVGDELRDKTPSGLWPSDHAGVIARLRIPTLMSN